MRESSVEKAVCDFAKVNGITMQKQNGLGNRGKADQLCMKAGVAAFLEVKAPGEEPTALQYRYMRERQADGFAASWCDNAADGIRFLKSVFKV